jgi:hypothetical protein
MVSLALAIYRCGTVTFCAGALLRLRSSFQYSRWRATHPALGQVFPIVGVLDWARRLQDHAPGCCSRNPRSTRNGSRTRRRSPALKRSCAISAFNALGSAPLLVKATCCSAVNA